MSDAVSEIIYRVNDRDEIVHVSEGWCAFARANHGPEDVLHRPLWDFVADPTTRQLYRDVLAAVRGGRVIHFELRCDSPAIRRLLEMVISPADAGQVEFRTRVLWEQPRPPAEMLGSDPSRSGELLRACGWCKLVNVGGEWVEVEQAVARLRLFDRPRLPMLTHGICDGCYARMIQTLASG
jgi:hypothetical protein